MLHLFVQFIYVDISLTGNPVFLYTVEVVWVNHGTNGITDFNISTFQNLQPCATTILKTCIKAGQRQLGFLNPFISEIAAIDSSFQ